MTPGLDPNTTPRQVRRLAAEIFILGYPLVLMDTVRQAHPNTVNQFFLLPDRCETLAAGLSHEDARTLRASAWIDLSKGPVVLSLPDLRGRHGLLTLIDAWGETFAALGSRTHTDAGHDLALIGPRWRGELTPGVEVQRARTDLVWALSRIAPHGAADHEAARAVLGRHFVLPLQRTGEPVAPAPLLGGAPPVPLAEVAAELEPGPFFSRLSALLQRHPLHRIDPEAVRILVALGVEGAAGGEAPRWGGILTEAVAKGVRDGRAILRQAVWNRHADASPDWRLAPGAPPGADPLTRAAAAYHALGAPPVLDVLHLVCDADDQGERLDGAGRYRLHFPRGETPPAKAFWSLSLARPANPADLALRRRALSDRDALAFNRDGSLDILIQHSAPPVVRASNWLPAPSGEFALAMRLHWPEPTALAGLWSMPRIEKLAPERSRRLDSTHSAPGPPG